MDREDDVLEYITQNPGCSRTEVIDFMDPPEGIKRAAPNTTNRILDRLLKENKVIRKLDKDGRTNHLYTNDKNKFNMINQLLSKMREMLGEINKQKQEPDGQWITNNSPRFRQVCVDSLHRLLIDTDKIIPIETDCHKLYYRTIKVLKELETTFYQSSKDKDKDMYTVVETLDGQIVAMSHRTRQIISERPSDIETIRNLLATIKGFKPLYS